MSQCAACLRYTPLEDQIRQSVQVGACMAGVMVCRSCFKGEKRTLRIDSTSGMTDDDDASYRARVKERMLKGLTMKDMPPLVNAPQATASPTHVVKFAKR